ncbi:hypothetical protein FXB39_00665 [Nocardioides sp. BGMRC 2183]|nr:hypothetical protein FXB39_00665 [Nocardioides sp. BGMRC 2183]
MSTRRLTVTKVSPSCDVVSGYGSRELVTEVRGRPPMWSSRPRGWVVQPKTSADVIALAESRGFEVVIESEVDRAS